VQTQRRSAACVLIALLAAAATAAAQGSGAPAPAKASVDQLAWISGAWSGTLGDRTIEQHWMTPLGTSMVGMYRSIRDNKATLYEILAIEQDGEGVALRIKHFAPGAGLVSQEAKDESANHALVALEPRKAVFAAATATGPVRVTFSSPDSSSLTIVVERHREGKPVATEFKYKKAARP
jgi:hypothetical protein